MSEGVMHRAELAARSGLDRLPEQARQWARRAAQRLQRTGRPDQSSSRVAPLVSIVLPVFDVEDYLTACLDSVLDQTYRRLQVVAVDDGSRDDSFEILQARADWDHRLQSCARRTPAWVPPETQASATPRGDS